MINDSVIFGANTQCCNVLPLVVDCSKLASFFFLFSFPFLHNSLQFFTVLYSCFYLFICNTFVCIYLFICNVPKQSVRLSVRLCTVCWHSVALDAHDELMQLTACNHCVIIITSVVCVWERDSLLVFQWTMLSEWEREWCCSWLKLI